MTAREDAIDRTANVREAHRRPPRAEPPGVMVEPAKRSSYETLVACPHCLGAVNASLEVERAILDVLTRLALAPAWDGAKAPRLDAVVTRLVQDYRERVQKRVTADQLSDVPHERTQGGQA